MGAVSSNMHPSQTVMSMFKEPARAVTAIQSFLDGSKASCALLSDLAKAFERVNPCWILALLRSKGAPAWVILCCLNGGLLTKSKGDCYLVA